MFSLILMLWHKKRISPSESCEIVVPNDLVIEQLTGKPG